MGRPKKNLEDMKFDGWDQLDALILWTDEECIAFEMGISVDTLYRRIKERYDLTYAEYRDIKRDRLNRNLRKKQYDTAMEGNPTMLIWLGKNNLGQADKVHSTHDGNVDFKLAYNLDDDEEEK